MRKLFLSPYFICISLLFILLSGCKNRVAEPSIDVNKLADDYFREDANWYIDNIPFFECSDKQIEQVYYYRWKMYKAHIRNVGQNEFVITEFINHVGWDRDPYCTIVAAAMHHIYEGRWLKDNSYINGYISNLCLKGGNNRNYSESIADAVYAYYLVNADTSFVLKQLDSLEQRYNDWSDHYDSLKQLYYIAAMPDATEYNIAAIDASGGKDGFAGGEAFRPSINSYMYGNAMAISRLLELKGDSENSNKWKQKADDLKANIIKDLWNDSFHHFMDRYQQDNQFVHYWDFIRGRELAGMIPWNFNLPPDDTVYSSAWKQLTDTSRLLGKHGFRTNEPSYQYYFHQFLYYLGQRGSQWNGPSWPYQTSLALNAMANLLNNYNQDYVTKKDYVSSLRLFTKQHFLPDGKINLVENYDPNAGGPIVYYYWSNHYNHSSYNNLVISGLCGIRPAGNDTLVINPLVDETIKYFCLKDVLYHGHKLTLVYDSDGTKYHIGKELTVFVDGKKTDLKSGNGKNYVLIGNPIVTPIPERSVNYALNIDKRQYPRPSSSVNSQSDTSLYQAIDGRIWYFPEITNRWTTAGSNSSSDWYAIDFGEPKGLSKVQLYFIADSFLFAVPDSVSFEIKNANNEWKPLKPTQQSERVIGNTVTSYQFEKTKGSAIRVNFVHSKKQVAFSEIECY
ncbi:MAG TPA: discoidin domain-containing protein [Chitinophagaceae bacterium]|nr:discoidin domain-containing protein [Chitinophagaceae bacterium]